MQWYSSITIVERRSDPLKVDSKMSTVFQFTDWTEEIYRTKKEIQSGKPSEIRPVEVSKGTVNRALTNIASLTSGILQEPAEKLLRYCEKELRPGLSVYMKEAQTKEDARELVIETSVRVNEAGEESQVDFIKEPKDSCVFRSFLVFLQKRLEELDEVTSTANPKREALNILAKLRSLAFMEEIIGNIPAAMDAWKARELTRIQNVYEMGLTVGVYELREYVAEKAKNGTDPEDGTVLLKAPKAK